MSIIDTSVKKPVTITMGLMAIFILGFVSLSKLAVDFFPDIEFPGVMVMVNYPGAGPEEVEKSISQVIEQAVGTVSDIDELTSVSSEGSSIVQIQFNWGTDIDASMADIRDKLDLVADMLPDEATSPVLFRFSMDMMPIMVIGFYGTEDLAYLYNLADNDYSRKISQVAGVANVSISGGVEEEVHVDVSKNRLEAYGLDFSTLAYQLYSENQNTAGGYTYEGSYKYTIRTTGEFETTEDIEDVIVTIQNGVPIRLGDVANVDFGYNEDSSVVTIQQKPGLTMAIYKESGLNTVTVAEDVNEVLEELKEDLPPGVEIATLVDFSENITESIGGVGSAALFGGLFALIIILIYLWDIRSMLIIGISIPTSIIATFILMFFFDVTLNIISLAGLSLGVGMMVDASIVVLENIFYHRKQGMGRYSASVKGGKEVIMAISASTVTTMAVFLPIIFVEGMIAQIFRDLALTVVISLGCSLVVAITVIPMLTSKIKSLEKGPLLQAGENRFNKILQAVDDFYGRVLEKTLKHKIATVFSSIGGVLLIGGLLLVVIGKENFGSMDEGSFVVNIELPTGTRQEYTEILAYGLEQDILNKFSNDIELISVDIASGGFLGTTGKENTATIDLDLVSKMERSMTEDEVMECVRVLAEQYPMEVTLEKRGMGSQMLGGGLELEIIGDDLDTSDDLAEQVMTLMAGIEGLRDIELDRENALPELEVVVNRSVASQVGLNASGIATAIESAFGGTTATTMEDDDGTTINVVVRLQEEDRMSLDELLSLSIVTPMGQLVPLSSLVDVEKSFGPTQIRREESTRVLNISAVIFGREMNEVVAELQEAVDENVYIPRGFEINFGGSFEEMVETFMQLIIAFGLGLVLIYAIMASQFESLVAPFVIMLAVPFGAVGSLIFLYITRATLSSVSAIGIVVLIGIVINNGIVLIDYTNQLIREGNGNDDAAIKAGMRRFRPVSMTTLTTILGLLPMALGIGQGGELYGPLAVSILGGLTISFMFTMVVVPTAYAGIRNKFPLKLHEDEDLINSQKI